MNLGPTLLMGLFIFVLVFVVTVARRYTTVLNTGWNRRSTFEAWARSRDLDLTRSRVVPDQYEYRETWLAWEAFNLGVNTPREIRV